MTRLTKAQWIHRYEVNQERTAAGLGELSEFQYLKEYRSHWEAKAAEAERLYRQEEQEQAPLFATLVIDPFEGMRAMLDKAIGSGDLNLAKSLLTMHR